MRYSREEFDQDMRVVRHEDDQAKERSDLRSIIRSFGRLDWLGSEGLLGCFARGYKHEAQRRLELTTQQPEPFY